MNRIFKLTDALGLKKRGLVISENANQASAPHAETVLARAREIAARSPDPASSNIILELCTLVDGGPSDMGEIRREVFREAVKGIANVIRNGQLPADLPLAQMVPGGYGSPELLAAEIERANATEPVGLPEMRQIRQKLKSATEGSEDIDDGIKRLYYARMFDKAPSTENILPPGSPSRSLDLAALIVQRILPNGWWTMGSNGENLAEPPVAKVGTWAGDDPKPESGPTPALTLLSALILTLIETAKKDG